MKKRITAWLLSLTLCLSVMLSPVGAAALDATMIDTTDEEITDTVAVTDTTEEEAVRTPSLVTDEHVVYIAGKGDGTFDPDGEMTRAEAATIIARLLDTDELGDVEFSFADVNTKAWYYPYVQLLASWGIVSGVKEDGIYYFKPTDTITRGEFVTILCNVYGYIAEKGATTSFTDLSTSYWGYRYIVVATELGWISGYTDGTVRAQNNISRAEAVTVMNKVLGRSASAKTTKTLIANSGARQFCDVDSSAWYYYQVMEAATPHEYTLSGTTETWTELTLVDCGLSAGWNTVGSYRYYVNADGQFEAWTSGLQTIDGTTCYVDSKGRIPLNAAGIYTVDGTDYYVTKTGTLATSAGRLIANNNIYYYDASSEVYRTVYGDQKMVALTYDDGPSSNTSTILDVLEEYNSVATFFVVGNRVSTYSSTVKRAYSMGCQIGNHTYDHTTLTTVSTSTIASQISKTNQAVKNVTGVAPTVMRPPGGSVNSTVKSNVGMPIILWSIDTLDWKTRNATSTINSVLNNVKDGDIVLMHDLYEATATASKTIIPRLISAGYQLVTIEELSLLRGSMSNGTVYYSFR